MPVSIASLTSPDPELADPMPVQIYRDLLSALRDGRLADGATLPSSRAAARALGLSRTTLITAYDLLRAEGVLLTRQGAAPKVVAPPSPPPDAQPKGAAPRPSARGGAMARDHRQDVYAADRGVMAPGTPDETLFPRDEWALALRRAAQRRHGEASAYGMLHGVPELRQAIAERLTSDRGVRADPQRILITPGTQASLALLAQVMTDAGETVAMECPGYAGARAAFTGAGLSIAPVPVDAEGIAVTAIPDDARLIYVTPSNQYPLGYRMSLSRRMALLDHARRHAALILEDDYDSEFLWRGREIAALAAHGPEQVAYLGSAAKVLIPALRIGWMMLPDALVAPMRAAQRNLGLLVNLHGQYALAEMMRSGRYRTHLRRITRAYETRGLALADALADLPGIALRPPDGGVQLALRFCGDQDEGAVLAACGRAGFRPSRLSASSLGAIRGLIVGFADATPQRIRGFRDVLAGALRAHGKAP
ncbi:GntR family transcriptional regulator / MocR family aminotransferase [Paracoccus isoporae]|uniref:GntR family transcriptional regulator / MocR family aminotransferase n=1 Tax=Paracoccus isoporae TaxID=591205 RepID=A0A1G6U5E8_9RHOB|nr:PLP-dependent aminotransferase family protein [Paracoccus isoporae]SDD35807.1 GntR family transcriptional regulator / MocR family aminotransferase [Paracoccus isoporae]